MKIGVAAVALAASALLATTPANAQQGIRVDPSATGFQLQGRSDLTLRGANLVNVREDRNNFRGDRGRRGHHDNRYRRYHDVHRNGYGQTVQEVKYLADKAIYACACQLDIDARRYGFKDGNFHDTPYYEQVGPNKFVVKGGAKLFDGYDYSRQSYECVVKDGYIRNTSNLYPVRYRDNGHHNRRDRYRGYGGVSFSFGNIW